MKRKPHIRVKFEDVLNTIISDDYQLITSKEEYEDVSYEPFGIYRELATICPNNHEYTTNYKNFKNKNRCPICSGRKIDIIKIKEKIHERGFLLPINWKEPTESKLKFDVLCKKHGIFSINWNNLSHGHGCLGCAKEIKKIKSTLSQKEIIKRISNRGFQFIKKENKKVILKCPNNHEFSIKMVEFSSGRGCAKCAGNTRFTLNEVKNKINNISDYIVVDTEYKNCSTKIKMQCPNKHLCSISWSNFSKGHRCSKCKLSKNEKECREIFENIFNKKFPTVRPNFLKNPETNFNLELDGYCEELKLAFEYDGKQHYRITKHWGGPKALIETQKRDLLKNKLCKDYGIILIRIPYFVKNKEEYIKGMINTIC